MKIQYRIKRASAVRRMGAACVCLAACFVSTATAADEVIYDARVRGGEILTPLPGEAPRINGPRVYGSRPDKEFVYRIPCQGRRPMEFVVEGLPGGLKLDAESGVIRGRTPAEAGSYEMTLRATNGHGGDTRRFRLIVGDKISLTPPVGYSTWGGQMLNVDEKTVLKALDVFVNQGLADAGFQYICIDDGWARIDPDIYAGNLEGFEESGFHTDAARKWAKTQFRRMGDFDSASVVGKTRDDEGRPLPNHHFPDMKAMVGKIHSHGLKAGIYSSPGIVTCQLQMGSFGHEEIDARQVAEWGFDFFKYDRCGIKFRVFKAKAAGEEYGLDRLWQPMVRHLREQDRDIVYNLCQYGMHQPWTWAPQMDMQSWRIGGDLNHHPEDYYRQAMRIAKTLREFSKPGQWNDPDYMYIHKIKDAENKGAPAREIKLTTNQRYQYVSLWSIICAPFFFSSDINEIDEFTIRLVGNGEIVNVNQDELGEVARVVRETEEALVMTKPLADGGKVLAVFNRDGENEAVIPVTWKELELEGPQAVRDLWRCRDLDNQAEGMKVRLSPSGCAVLLLQKP